MLSFSTAVYIGVYARIFAPNPPAGRSHPLWSMYGPGKALLRVCRKAPTRGRERNQGGPEHGVAAAAADADAA
eukprot:CAMPEP_0204544116 /NCGR_PEP_ID=MMETSP0661-20131031/20306_1 /ASSEMBLY_ACC=CAM_ASM_000606 /TAXON_ID=109239 /ORGANISM="Alexandrium margalefi, Strain AMGDE01CS-322" /LENGTH=72 /DNA_ID=CAMNT_0051550871 /DNA_START=87 /DNA_END=302 /DNA_ORIENTATION=-